MLLVGLFAVAINLRIPLAGYPPLLETARADLAASAGFVGAVQAGALLAMALGSLIGSMIGRQLGHDRALGLAVGVVGLGCLVRGIAAMTPLAVGSVMIGLGIGLAGVQLSGVVKERLADHAGAATGGYVFVMMIGATVSSAAAVPISDALGGWSRSLAVWALPAILGAAVWMTVTRWMPSRHQKAPSRASLPWRDSFTRLAARHQAGTSLLFYGWLTWLAPYYQSHGWSAQRAGLLVAVWSLSSIPAALLVPAIAERQRRWRRWSLLMLSCIALGTLGALVAPTPPVVGPWLWIVAMGVAAGSGFPLGMTVIAWRTSDGAGSAATSAVALTCGYVVAAIGPVLMGLLVDLTGDHRVAISVLFIGVAVQATAIVRIGDQRTVNPVAPADWRVMQREGVTPRPLGRR